MDANLRLIIVGVLAQLAVGCTCQGPLPPFDPPTGDCEIPDPTFDTSRLDPCVDGDLIGSFSLTREAGQPNVLEEAIELPEGRICVRVINDGAASARVSLGGEVLFGPSDFNPHVTQLVTTFESSGGAQTLRVRETSIPGSVVTVELRAISATPDPVFVEAQTDLVEMQRAFCNEFNLNIDAFIDTDVADALANELVAGGTPLGRIIVHRNVYGVPSFMGLLPTEDLGLPPRCGPRADRARLGRTTCRADGPDGQ